MPNILASLAAKTSNEIIRQSVGLTGTVTDSGSRGTRYMFNHGMNAFNAALRFGSFRLTAGLYKITVTVTRSWGYTAAAPPLTQGNARWPGIIAFTPYFSVKQFAVCNVDAPLTALTYTTSSATLFFYYTGNDVDMDYGLDSCVTPAAANAGITADYVCFDWNIDYYGFGVGPFGKAATLTYLDFNNDIQTINGPQTTFREIWQSLSPGTTSYNTRNSLLAYLTLRLQPFYAELVEMICWIFASNTTRPNRILKYSNLTGIAAVNQTQIINFISNPLAWLVVENGVTNFDGYPIIWREVIADIKSVYDSVTTSDAAFNDYFGTAYDIF
jgi:hypothetical protein